MNQGILITKFTIFNIAFTKLFIKDLGLNE